MLSCKTDKHPILWIFFSNRTSVLQHKILTPINTAVGVLDMIGPAGRACAAALEPARTCWGVTWQRQVVWLPWSPQVHLGKKITSKDSKKRQEDLRGSMKSICRKWRANKEYTQRSHSLTSDSGLIESEGGFEASLLKKVNYSLEIC